MGREKDWVRGRGCGGGQPEAHKRTQKHTKARTTYCHQGRYLGPEVSSGVWLRRWYWARPWPVLLPPEPVKEFTLCGVAPLVGVLFGINGEAAAVSSERGFTTFFEKKLFVLPPLIREPDMVLCSAGKVSTHVSRGGGSWYGVLGMVECAGV